MSQYLAILSVHSTTACSMQTYNVQYSVLEVQQSGSVGSTQQHCIMVQSMPYDNTIGYYIAMHHLMLAEGGRAVMQQYTAQYTTCCNTSSAVVHSIVQSSSSSRYSETVSPGDYSKQLHHDVVPHRGSTGHIAYLLGLPEGRDLLIRNTLRPFSGG